MAAKLPAGAPALELDQRPLAQFAPTGVVKLSPIKLISGSGADVYAFGRAVHADNDPIGNVGPANVKGR